ncbi:jasmonic acid-amido synthetase JAR1 isoform X1 [Cucumis melo var. makuwa]|uniref:Jasmonic acid-amido synthetase JAR1 isoform X1 n=1 Tax=Cucumis melo var. makuwa TaxID=1194695 RepID=A0A5D3B9T4_CUCMM|nr:jasmonic acid-amido synthetase JAR1 isoform X1 [Cucumis melo var. makuwa]
MKIDELCEEEEDIIDWFEQVSSEAAVAQSRTLRKILQQNYGVEYLKKWVGDVNIHEIPDDFTLQSIFTSLIPLSSHAHFEPFLQRIADGDSSPLLTQQPITTLSLSSGTTEGRQKYVPFTPHSAHTTLLIFRLAAAYRSRVYPTREGGKILEFIYSSKQTKTKGGITTGTATTHYYASEEFKIKQLKTKSFTCSPQEVISGCDYKQSTYCHLLLGLLYSEEVEFVTSTFAYTIVQAFNQLEESWEEIIHDISHATLSSRIDIPEIRKAVLKVMSPKPELGWKIRRVCEELKKEGWLGLIPKLWPNCKYVYSIMTGSMQPYLKKLRHYGGGLPLVSGDYGSTESWIGVNVDPYLPPENVTFAVIPTFSYFEFIPLFKQHATTSSTDTAIHDFLEGQPIALSEVKIGQQYELVLTTFTGLYRCRLGDVVEVAGFHNKTPKLNFICRRKLVLTVNIDKNTEKDVQLAVERGSQLMSQLSGAELVDFTSYAELSNQPGHYVIFWEVKGDVNDTVLGKCCSEMDAAFVDYGYVVSRKANSIGPLELRIVERGSFNKILEYYIGNGAALSQFKTPRCTTNHFLLNILNLSTLQSFFSTAYA